MKLTLHCLTATSRDTHGFPENTYEADSIDEAARILHNVTRKRAGIVEVRIEVNEPHEDEPISEEPQAVVPGEWSKNASRTLCAARTYVRSLAGHHPVDDPALAELIMATEELGDPSEAVTLHMTRTEFTELYDGYVNGVEHEVDEIEEHNQPAADLMREIIAIREALP